MKQLKSLVVLSSLSVSLGACSSESQEPGASTGGTGTGGSGLPSGGTDGSGATSSSGGANATGGNTSSGGTNATGGNSSGGSGNNPDAVVATCAGQTYTPNPSQSGVCASSEAHGGPIANFEAAEQAGWFGAYANETEGTTTVPASFQETPISRVSGGANGTGHSVHYVGSGFNRGFRLNTSFGECQDVGDYTGLSFWAKGTIAAEDAGGWDVAADQIIVQLGTQNTLPAGEGGDCTVDCGGHPDFRVTISSDWKEYRIPFDCFGQGDVFDGHLLSLLFVVRGASFDVGIDEISFY